MVDVNVFEGFAKFLQVYGGWGMCVVLIAGIVLLYRNANKTIAAQNVQLQQLLRETIEVLTRTRDSNSEVAETNRKTNEVLEAASRELELLEKLRRDG